MLEDWLRAEDCYERAQRFSESQRWIDALRELDRALEIHPDNGVWHGNRGFVLDQLQRYDDAIESYAAALEIDPHDRETNVALGIDLARVQRHAEALKVFEHVASEHSEYEPAYCHRIHVFAQLGQHEDAEQMFYLAQQLDDRCPHCFYHMGASLLARGLTDRAIFCFEQTLEHCPEYPDVRRQLADAYRAKGNVPKARELYLAELRHQLGDTQLLCDLADLELEAGDQTAAANTCKLVTDLEPRHTGAWFTLGRLALANGDADMAVEHLYKAVAGDPPQPGVHEKLGAACLRAGRTAAALHHLTIAINENPEDLHAHMAMGNCLLELGKVKRAAEHFERLVELAPELPGPHHNLAVCAYLQGDYEAGVAHCRAALERKPDYVMAMQKLAIGHLHLRQVAQAREWVRRARQLAPDDEGVRRLARRCRLAIVALALLGWWRPLWGVICGTGRRATVAPEPGSSDHVAARMG
jgi:tetratricopeptide (TPR) repeat protein